jgi:hypothetical protein
MYYEELTKLNSFIENQHLLIFKNLIQKRYSIFLDISY